MSNNLKWDSIFAPGISTSLATKGLNMRQDSIDALTKVLNGITQPKLSKQRVIDSLLGKKSNGIISNSTPARKRRKRREPQQVIAPVEQPEPAAGGSDNIPGLPEGTKQINENLWLLPDGRFLMKNQEDEDETV